MTPAMNTTVSVVVPTFNGAAFIKETLESVCREVIEGDEIIVVDDASSDQTVALAKQLLSTSCPSAWQVLSQTTNSGPPAARNVGIRLATGDIIMSVDQDDRWSPGHRSVLLEKLTGHDIVAGRALFSLSPEARDHPGPRWWREAWLTEPQQLCEFGASAITRMCFEEIGLLDESFRFGGDDVEWFGRAQAAGLTRREIPDVVLKRTIHSANLSGDPRLRQELLDVVRHHIARGEQ